MSRKTELPVGTVTHWKPSDESCGNCKFCLSWIVSMKPATNAEIFECRRYPPTVIFDSGGFTLKPRYPLVESIAWCGEWKPRQ